MGNPRKASRGVNAALAVAMAHEDQRAEFLAKAQGNTKAFSGVCGNFTKDTPLFAMKSNPGFQRTGTVRGRTYRGGKQGTIKIQRENPAKGEERMAPPRLKSYETPDGEAVQFPAAPPPRDRPQREEVIDSLGIRKAGAVVRDAHGDAYRSAYARREAHLIDTTQKASDSTLVFPPRVEERWSSYTRIDPVTGEKVKCFTKHEAYQPPAFRATSEAAAESLRAQYRAEALRRDAEKMRKAQEKAERKAAKAAQK